MATETEMQRIIGEALWQAGIDGTFPFDEPCDTGIMIRTDDGAEFRITITKNGAD